MKITCETIRRIKAACREQCGGRRSVEIGDRSWPTLADDADPNIGFNMLLWGPDNDLSDLSPVNELAGKDVPDYHGFVTLDCYCYNLMFFGREPADALDTNVYVLIHPDGTVTASDDDLGHDQLFSEILIAAGVPVPELH